MRQPMDGTPDELHHRQDVELFASRATEVGGQLDLLLDLIRAEKLRAGKLPRSNSEGSRKATSPIPIKDIHSAAAAVAGLQDQLVNALALYRKQRLKKQRPSSIARLPPRRVPTIITSFHDQPDSPREVVSGRGGGGGAYHVRPRGSPLVRQRADDREVSCGLDSREPSMVDFSLRKQFSVGFMDTTESRQITQVSSEYVPRLDQDVHTAAAKAERVRRQFDQLVERYVQLQAENRQLRQMVRHQEERSEGDGPNGRDSPYSGQAVMDGARVEELERQLEEAEERAAQLQQRNSELEDALAAACYGDADGEGLPPGSSRTDAGAGPDVPPSPTRPAFCDRSASPITREAAGADAQLQALRMHYEQCERVWLAEKQELLERLDDLTRRLEDPQVTL
eukprot:EG_transcript_13940